MVKCRGDAEQNRGEDLAVIQALLQIFSQISPEIVGHG